MEEYLIVADIAGQFSAFLRLIAQVPETTKIIAVGDLVDRGPKSREVVQWFMDNKHRAESLQGNHEHMMVDFLDHKGIYDDGVWYSNGGTATIKSYDPVNRFFVPSNHIDFLFYLPRYKMIKGEGDVPDLFISHAALHPKLTIEEAAQAEDFDDPNFFHGLLWNRGEPEKKPYFQVMGHNSHWGLRWFEDWAVCLDQSHSHMVTGMKWPSREIITETY